MVDNSLDNFVDNVDHKFEQVSQGILHLSNYTQRYLKPQIAAIQLEVNSLLGSGN